MRRGSTIARHGRDLLLDVGALHRPRVVTNPLERGSDELVVRHGEAAIQDRRGRTLLRGEERIDHRVGPLLAVVVEPEPRSFLGFESGELFFDVDLKTISHVQPLHTRTSLPSLVFLPRRIKPSDAAPETRPSSSALAASMR